MCYIRSLVIVCMPAFAGALSLPAGEAEFAATTIPLSGPGWRIHDDDDGKGAERRMFEAESSASGWVPATVPGNIQADLEAARRIPPYWLDRTDPLLAKPPASGSRVGLAEMFKRCDFTVRGGDPRFLEVARKDWWYRKDFEVPPSFEGRRVKLVFDGVDHECEVWLNGRRIGGHAGMYRQMAYDVAEALRPGQINRLAVRIARMPPALEADIGMPKQIKAYRHELAEIKSPSFGLDWGLGVFAMGIWRDVRLEASGPARIEYVQVQTKLAEPNTIASVLVRLEIDSFQAMPVKGRFRIEGQGAVVNAVMVAADLKVGVNRIEARMTLDNPSLWWPVGHGSQPLYQLQSELVDVNGVVLHHRSTRFGVRDVRWVAVEGAEKDAAVRSQLVVNGRKIRFQGTNIIPPDTLPGRQHVKADWLLRMAHAAGMNVVRNWAGTTMRGEWYDLADELGILVQQEMPATNSGESWPQEYSAYTAAFERTATSIVKQLRNHPCIVEWSGGNEMGWPPGGGSIVPMLHRLFAEMDDRIFRIKDPDLGWKHGPYNASPEKFYRNYNESVAIRRGEFGAPGPAHLETWHRDIPPASQWPLRDDDPALVAKNVFFGWVGNTWLQPHVISSQFGALQDLPSLIRAGQWISADQLRYAMDAMRRGGSRTSGFMSWVFNEPWRNGAGNTVVDYDGRPLMNYFYARQALTPIALSLRYDSLLYPAGQEPEIELFLSSDAPQTATGLRWKWLVRDRRGDVCGRASGVATIAPLEVQSLGKIRSTLPAKTAPGPLLVELRLEDSVGTCLSERLHVFAQDGSPGPFAGLLEKGAKDADDNEPQTVPNLIGRPVRRTTVEASVKAYYEKGVQEALVLQVRNTGAMTALFCEPHPLVSYRTDLFVDNNYGFIPPGESRTITIRTDRNAACGLTLAQTGWRLSCWNANDVVIEPSADILLAVGREDQMCREFAGYFDPGQIKDTTEVTLEGMRPDPSRLPYLLDGKKVARFAFALNHGQAAPRTRLRIHTADQSKEIRALVEVTVNGKRFEQLLPEGLGVQFSDPAHLAFPATAIVELPFEVLRKGKNTVEVRVKNGGWFTWDAIDISSQEHSR